MWGYDLVTFWKLPNLTDRDLPHLDLPTSEKLANLGRINPRNCNDRRYLTETSPRHCKGITLKMKNHIYVRESFGMTNYSPRHCKEI